jgi:hypothetical protein
MNNYTASHKRQTFTKQTDKTFVTLVVAQTSPGDPYHVVRWCGSVNQAIVVMKSLEGQGYNDYIDLEINLEKAAA